jgi:hypothetical protein
MKAPIVLALLMLPSLATGLAGRSQYAAIVDATGQRANAPRGRGPFPGAASAGHSADFPLQLTAQFPQPELRADGTAPVDFVLTNIGPTTIHLPIAVEAPPTNGPQSVLILWLTSDDGLVEHYFRDQATGQLVKIAAISTSAELLGDPTNPLTYAALEPDARLLVHASSRVQLKTGTHAIASHTQLLLVDGPPVVRSHLVGWADSAKVTALFTSAIQPVRDR